MFMLHPDVFVWAIEAHPKSRLSSCIISKLADCSIILQFFFGERIEQDEEVHSSWQDKAPRDRTLQNIEQQKQLVSSNRTTGNDAGDDDDAEIRGMARSGKRNKVAVSVCLCVKPVAKRELHNQLKVTLLRVCSWILLFSVFVSKDCTVNYDRSSENASRGLPNPDSGRETPLAVRFISRHHRWP